LKFKKEEIEVILELLDSERNTIVQKLKNLDQDTNKLDLLEKDKVIAALIQRIKQSKITPPGASEVQKEILNKTAKKKVDLSMEKINKAIDELTQKGKKVSISSVSKLSGVAYNTAKKYKGYILQD